MHTHGSRNRVRAHARRRASRIALTSALPARAVALARPEAGAIPPVALGRPQAAAMPSLAHPQASTAHRPDRARARERARLPPLPSCVPSRVGGTRRLQRRTAPTAPPPRDGNQCARGRPPPSAHKRHRHHRRCPHHLAHGWGSHHLAHGWGSRSVPLSAGTRPGRGLPAAETGPITSVARTPPRQGCRGFTGLSRAQFT